MADPNVPSDHAAVANAIAPLQMLAEAAVGYRRKLIEGGCSESLADDLTAAFHATMMDTVKTGLDMQQKGRR